MSKLEWRFELDRGGPYSKVEKPAVQAMTVGECICLIQNFESKMADPALSHL